MSSKSMIKAASGILLAGALAFPVQAVDWLGGTSTSWTNSANWSGSVPTSTDVARFNTGTYANQPTVDGEANAKALLMTAGSGAVTLGAGNTLTIAGTGGSGDAAIDLRLAKADMVIDANVALTGWCRFGVTNGRTLTMNGNVTGSQRLDLTGDQPDDPWALIGTGGTVILNGTGNSFSAIYNKIGTLEVKSFTGIPLSEYYIQGSAVTRPTFRYTGPGASSTWKPKLTPMAGVGGGYAGIDASGTGVLTLNNTAAVVYTGDQTPVTFVLSGDNTDTNTLAWIVGDNGNNKLTLVKSGAGTWVLAGANTYSGDTVVSNGILVVRGSSIKDPSNLIISGGKVQPVGTEIVGSLFFGATLQAGGTWGATGSGAEHVDDDRFSGTGGVVRSAPPGFVDITNVTGSITVSGVTSYTLVGTNINTVGDLRWTNTLSGTTGTTTPSGGAWSCDIPLAAGVNAITVSGTNIIGIVAQDSATIIKSSPPVITNEAAKWVSVTFATACGNLTATNYAATVKLYYGAADGGTNPNNWDKVTDLGVKEQGSVTCLITNMTGVTYYRFYATNTAGEAWCPVTTAITPLIPQQVKGYAKLLPVSFSGYTGAGMLLNFPALVTLSTNITGFSYSDLLSGNNDILIVDEAGSPLNYEIDTWNPDGTSLLWVQVPLFVQNVQIKVYYGKSSVTEPVCRSNGAVWTEGFSGVWHMANSNTVDVSVNGHTGTGTGTTDASGRIGLSQSYGGSGYISVANSDTLLLGDTNCTVSAWIKTSSGSVMGVVTKDNNGTHSDGDKLLGVNYSSARLGIDHGWVGNLNGTRTVNNDTWHHIVWTQAKDVSGNNEQWYLYVDGVQDASASDKPTKSDVVGNTVRIGSGSTNSYFPNMFFGLIDEVRISRVTRSAEWIKAEYDSQNAPGSFVTYGTVQKVYERGTMVSFY